MFNIKPKRKDERLTILIIEYIKTAQYIMLSENGAHPNRPKVENPQFLFKPNTYILRAFN